MDPEKAREKSFRVVILNVRNSWAGVSIKLDYGLFGDRRIGLDTGFDLICRILKIRLRSHYVIEWLHNQSFGVDFFGDGKELTGKTFARCTHQRKPWHTGTCMLRSLSITVKLELDFWQKQTFWPSLFLKENCTRSNILVGFSIKFDGESLRSKFEQEHGQKDGQNGQKSRVTKTRLVLRHWCWGSKIQGCRMVLNSTGYIGLIISARMPMKWFWLIVNISNCSRDLAWLRGGTTDVTTACACHSFTVCLTVFPFEYFDLGPSPSDSTEKNLSDQSLRFWSAVFL